MLAEEERNAVVAAARNGETGFALELMRAFSRSSRIEALPQLVAVFANSVETNKLPVRNYLAGRVPAILVNHYFPAILAQHSAYQDFIQYTLDNRGWEAPIVRAIVDGDASKLTVAVSQIIDRVLERHAETHQSR